MAAWAPGWRRACSRASSPRTARGRRSFRESGRLVRCLSSGDIGAGSARRPRLGVSAGRAEPILAECCSNCPSPPLSRVVGPLSPALRRAQAAQRGSARFGWAQPAPAPSGCRRRSPADSSRSAGARSRRCSLSNGDDSPSNGGAPHPTEMTPFKRPRYYVGYGWTDLQLFLCRRRHIYPTLYVESALLKGSWFPVWQLARSGALPPAIFTVRRMLGPPGTIVRLLSSVRRFSTTVRQRILCVSGPRWLVGTMSWLGDVSVSDSTG